MRDTVTFTDSDEWDWTFDLTFMLSHYRCIRGCGCHDIRLGRSARGCCVEGVEGRPRSARPEPPIGGRRGSSTGGAPSTRRPSALISRCTRAWRRSCDECAATLSTPCWPPTAAPTPAPAAADLCRSRSRG